MVSVKTLNTQTIPIWHILRMMFHLALAGPLPLFITICLRLINAAGFGIDAIIVAGFTNALINGEQVFLWCAMYLGVSALQILTDVLNHPTQMWFSNKAILYFQQRLLKHTAQIPLLHFMDAEFHDLLSRANRDFGERVVQWFRSVLDNIHCLATLVGVLGAVLIIGGGIWCAVAMVASAVVVLATQKPVVSLEQKKERQIVRAFRTQETWADILASRSNAAEIRLFSIQRWLLRKWEKSYHALANMELDTLKKIMRWDVLAGVSTLFGYVAVIFIAAVIAQRTDPKETAGIFTGLIYATGTLQGFLVAIVSSLATLVEQSGILRELAILFTIPAANTEKESNATQPHDPPTHSRRTTPHALIHMNALSFRYPHTDVQTLKDITAKIELGERVALVGKNGAGKTTLANILLGLYPLTTGSLQLNSEIHNNTVTMSAVFQNFVKFLLPVQDNVGLADIDRIHDKNAIRTALLKAGSTFSQDLEVWLGHEFGGRDVSGGEWLRIAVARGLFRNSRFVVFDEPTASIDPVAEVEMVRELLTKDKFRTTLVISHRLGVARLCDRILVLDDGRLVENGTHEALIANGGIYAQMWHAQAEWYT